jgi:hypothetical protein
MNEEKFHRLLAAASRSGMLYRPIAEEGSNVREIFELVDLVFIIPLETQLEDLRMKMQMLALKEEELDELIAVLKDRELDTRKAG